MCRLKAWADQASQTSLHVATWADEAVQEGRDHVILRNGKALPKQHFTAQLSYRTRDSETTYLADGSMAQFSGAVKLADLNDFIAPSQACVVNVDGSKKATLKLDTLDFDIRPEVCATLGYLSLIYMR